MAKDLFDESTLAVSGTVDTEEQETAPTDASKNNPSIAISYDGEDQPTTIEMTIGGTTYSRTLTWTSNNLTAISAWS